MRGKATLRWYARLFLPFFLALLVVVVVVMFIDERRFLFRPVS